MKEIIQNNVNKLKDTYYEDKKIETSDTIESLAQKGSTLIPRYMELFERRKIGNDLTDAELTEMISLSSELDVIKEKMESLKLNK